MDELHLALNDFLKIHFKIKKIVTIQPILKKNIVMNNFSFVFLEK